MRLLPSLMMMQSLRPAVNLQIDPICLTRMCNSVTWSLITRNFLSPSLINSERTKWLSLMGLLRIVKASRADKEYHTALEELERTQVQIPACVKPKGRGLKKVRKKPNLSSLTTITLLQTIDKQKIRKRRRRINLGLLLFLKMKLANSLKIGFTVQQILALALIQNQIKTPKKSRKNLKQRKPTIKANQVKKWITNDSSKSLLELWLTTQLHKQKKTWTCKLKSPETIICLFWMIETGLESSRFLSPRESMYQDQEPMRQGRAQKTGLARFSSLKSSASCQRNGLTIEALFYVIWMFWIFERCCWGEDQEQYIIKMRLSTMAKFGYHIVRRRPANQGAFLPLYESVVFKDAPADGQPLHNAQAAQRFKEYLPLILLGETRAYFRKNLVTRLCFNPEAQTLKIVSLRGRGLVTQQYSIDNIVPVTYADAIASDPYPTPVFPPFLDDTMLYYNKFTQDFLLFERDGTWNQETVSHEKLSLASRFNEAEWIDKRAFV